MARTQVARCLVDPRLRLACRSVIEKAYDAIIVLISQLCRKEEVDRQAQAMACCSLLLAIPGAVLSSIGLSDASGLVSEVTGYAEHGAEAVQAVTDAASVVEVTEAGEQGADGVADGVTAVSDAVTVVGPTDGDDGGVAQATTGGAEAASDLHWAMRQERVVRTHLDPSGVEPVAEGDGSADAGGDVHEVYDVSVEVR